MQPQGSPPERVERDMQSWRALWAMMVGFFMILVDSTIVAVANPRIMEKLNTDYDAVIWVTSAYLLAYAVPLLVAGRLGDRFGPKNLYLIGLTIFTATSLWCGLAGSIDMLIAARVVQGLGAALLTPQTLSTITRIFPPERRGVAMSVWGATAGVATLVGPLAGGALVDSLGWQWIFFVNVPVGVLGIALAVWLIPVLPTHQHRFDGLGVLLSGVAMFLIVFGLQEGQSQNWAPWIWGVIAGGVAAMGAFVYWQSVNTHEPLIPLRVFRDRDFSLSNVGIAVMGFVAVGMVLPLMFYLQVVCGLSPTRSALVTAPMAVATGLLAPVVGRIVDRSLPRPIVGFGFAVLSIALTWLSIEMTPTTPIWRLLLPFAAMGVGMAFVWAPLAATATRNLPPELAGAGSGVYNATRQVGSVLGSASMAAFMTWRINDELPQMPQGAPRGGEGAVTQLPAFLHQPFSDAMSISTLLTAFVALFGVVAALFLVGTAVKVVDIEADYVDDSEPRTDEIPVIPDLADDHSDYAEYVSPAADESITQPLSVQSDPARGEPVHLGSDNPYETLYHEPPNRWLHSTAEPIGLARNGLHVEHGDAFHDVSLPGRGRHAADSPPAFTWFDPDADSYGRHSMPAGD
ncbi:MAG TPA: MFS transporter [Mycobacterium sp.]|nr:MFS transporter [Mycobacterium sp.]